MAGEGGTVVWDIEDLRAVAPSRLSALLEEEVRNWRARLHWDFSASAELITRYVNLRALDGLALFIGNELVGYCYWVIEDRKALLGDLYVRDQWRNSFTESLLINAASLRVRDMATLPTLHVTRIESQLMQFASHECVHWGDDVPRCYPRQFQLAALDNIRRARALQFGADAQVCMWSPVWLEETARLLAAAYEGHVDAQINDQYRDVIGASRFLRNLVHYPGCGIYEREASFAAVGTRGEMLGCAIVTRVAAETGHVAQLCVRPDWHSRGLAYELLRRSMRALADLGCREASLTVTETNTPALRLYTRAGFRPIQRFSAFVWGE